MRPKILIASAAVSLLLISMALAAGSDPTQEPSAVVEAASPSAEAPETGPVPVPEPSEKAMRYYRSGNVLWWINLLWGLAVPILFLFTGFSARIRSWATKIGRKWFFILAIYLVAFLFLTFLIDLPLAYYQGFVRQHAYDLSNQAFGKWFGDALKGLMVGTVTAVLFGWFPYLLLRKSPRRWWLYTGLAALPFLFFMNLVSPLWIAPLFNDFGPMKDKALEAEILQLAERAGIEGSRVFEVDKSVDTKAVNAYVTGFLNSKRIVLWDTTLAKLDKDEVLYVMAHEMGHYVLKHVISLTFLIWGILLLGLYLVYRVSHGLIRRYEHRFGFSELADFASLPLIMLLFSLFFFVLSPFVLAISRHYEHESDRFGLELTRDNHAAASAFAKLQQENLGNPRPGALYKLWRASHPPLGERIDFCNTYKPWESTSTPMKYADRFRDGG